MQESESLKVDCAHKCIRQPNGGHHDMCPSHPGLVPMTRDEAIKLSDQWDTQRIYAPPDFKAHWVEDLSDEEYHADKTAVGSSSLRLMLDSPKAFHWGFFRGYEKPETKELRLGKLIHMAYLEGPKFKERFVVMPEFTGKTTKGEITTSANCKEVKEKRAEWIEKQHPEAVITTQDQVEIILGIMESLQNHPDAGLIFSKGRAEVSGYYRDQITGIRCKIRLDWLTYNLKILADLKSTRSAEKRKFGTQSFQLRVDLQVEMYRTGVQEITGKTPDFCALAAVEKTWPFESAIYTFFDYDLDQARMDYRKALDKLHACIQSGQWPQRQERAERIYTPRFFLDANVENQEEEAHLGVEND